MAFKRVIIRRVGPLSWLLELFNIMKPSLFFLSIIFVIVLVAIGTLNQQGYCVCELRKISTEEKLTLAIQKIIKSKSSGLIVPAQSNGEKILPAINYTNLSDFMRVNPECCKLELRGSEGRAPTFLETITGQVTSFAHISYVRRYRLTDGSIQSYLVSAQIPLSNCGSFK